MAAPFKKLKTLVSGEKEEQSALEELQNDCPCCASLSYSARVKGFIACFVIGIVLTVVGIMLIFTKHYIGFGVVYSLGTISAICSSFFLTGPVKQLKRMFEEKRLIATIIVIVMIALTLCAALWWQSGALALLFAILQFLAMTWYSLSYIPYARTAIKKCFSGMCG